MNELITKLYCSIIAHRQAERGQGALEYIAIVVGLIIMVALGFYLAGVDILKAAQNFVKDVVGSAGA